MKTTTKILFGILILVIGVLSYKFNSEVNRLHEINKTQNEVINNLLDRQEFLINEMWSNEIAKDISK